MPPTRKRGGAIHNSLIVDTPDKLPLMKRLMQKSGPGVVSYVLVYAPWCGACTRFRENVWDPSLNVPTTHNRIAVKDDVFNNSPMAKDVPDLKFLPSIFVVKDGVIQMHKKPGGDTAIIPTPKTKEEFLEMANVKLKPEENNSRANTNNSRVNANNTRANTNNSRVNANNTRVNANNTRVNANNTRVNANNTQTNANNSRTKAIKDIFVETESPVPVAIKNANNSAKIANNATKEVKKMTVALNNASRNTLRMAIQNVSKAVINAQEAAAVAKDSANSVKKMLEDAKGNLNTKINANAKAAVAAAAGAAVGAELAAAAATNAVNKNNNGSVVVLPNEEEVNISQIEMNFDEEGKNIMEPEEEQMLELESSNMPNTLVNPVELSSDAIINSKNPTPEVAPQTGGRRTRRSKGKLYRMLVSLNKKALKRMTRSKN